MKEEKEPEAKSASAPAQAAEAVPAVKPAAAKGKGSAIASMWSKAPAKKGARKPAPQQAAAQPSLRAKATAVDAEAFMRLNQQVHSLWASTCQQYWACTYKKQFEWPATAHPWDHADAQNWIIIILVCTYPAVVSGAQWMHLKD